MSDIEEIEHSLLSPSGAKRYLTCPGSVALSEGYPDDGNRYSAEGTAAHELASICIREDKPAEAYLGRVFVVESSGKRYEFEVDQTMAGNVQSYVDFTARESESMTDDPIVLCEERVDLAHILGEGEGGTVDFGVFSDGVVHAIDLKYGQGVKVYAGNNPQLLLYTAGLLKRIGGAEVTTIKMTIVQPRLNHVDTVTVTREALTSFLRMAKQGAAVVRRAIDEYVLAKEDDAQMVRWRQTYTFAEAEACRFCKAKGDCPTLHASAVATVVGRSKRVSIADTDWDVPPIDEPAKVHVEHVKELRGEYLAQMFAQTALVEIWVNAVKDAALAAALRGETVPGFKLVKGKAGPSQWVDKDLAAKLLSTWKFKVGEVYDTAVISPTNALKLIGKEDGKRIKKLTDNIRRTGGKPTLVPATDPRPELAGNPEEDFDDLTS